MFDDSHGLYRRGQSRSSSRGRHVVSHDSSSLSRGSGFPASLPLCFRRLAINASALDSLLLVDRRLLLHVRARGLKRSVLCFFLFLLLLAWSSYVTFSGSALRGWWGWEVGRGGEMDGGLLGRCGGGGIWHLTLASPVPLDSALQTISFWQLSAMCPSLRHCRQVLTGFFSSL